MADHILQNDAYRGGAQNHPSFLKGLKALAAMRSRGIPIPAAIPVHDATAMQKLVVNLEPTNGVAGAARVAVHHADKDNLVAYVPWYPAPLTFSLNQMTDLALRLMMRHGKLDREVMLRASDGHNELPARIAELRSAGICIASWPISGAKGLVSKLAFYAVVGRISPLAGVQIPGARRLTDALVEQLDYRIAVQREHFTAIYQKRMRQLDRSAEKARHIRGKLNAER